MQRNTNRVWLIACVLAMAGCSGSPQTMLSPTGVTPAATFVNPDGSTVKVAQATNLSPTGGTLVNTLRPTLTFSAPAGGRFAAAPFEYELEIQTANGTVYYQRPSVGTSHQLQEDLTYSDSFWWRIRARVGNQAGPWSNFAQIRTLDPPPPPPPPTVTPPPSAGGLPFAIPPSCLNGNGAICAFEMAGLSAEWGRCRAGDGVGCHRFTRQVVYALSRTDPNWQMIQAAPGGHACNCFSCGPSDGTMFREDTTVYGGRDVYDMIVGAGGPTPSLTWSFVGPPRNVDVPNNAPVCQ